jgi:glycosyltransferase involved in cell wall biosynthesis
VLIRRFPLHHIPLAPLSYSIWRYIVFPQLAMVLPIPWLKALCRFTPWSPELWRWAETTTETFDLVGAMGILYEPFVAVAHRVAQRQRIPFVVYPLTHLGAGPAPARDKVSRYYTMRHQTALATAADYLIAMTPTERDFYTQRGLPMERICVAGAGVTPEDVLGGEGERFRAQYSIRGPLVALVSALTYDKGAVHLVEAVRRLWQSGRHVELVLAGSVLAPFQRFLDSLPATDRQRLHVLGAVSEATKQDLLAAADVVAMPSRTDSFGIAYLEAWLYQKPVVGARAWGMQDVIANGRDGVLVPFGDVATLSATLAQLLDDPERRAALGRQGAIKVRQQYTWTHVYARVRSAYSQVGLR